MASGNYTSKVYDAGRSPTWDTVSWVETIPTGGDLKLQLAFSDDPLGPWTFKGPNGSTSAYYTDPAGEAATESGGASITKRYARYKAFFTRGTDDESPTLSEVHLSHSGENGSSLRLYAYDAAGNRVLRVVQDDTGVILTETLDDAGWSASDRITDLNQVKRRDEFDGTNTYNYYYTYNSNGNMTQRIKKLSGVTQETLDFSFDEDNRLTLIKRDGVNLVAYSYDSWGRMLTRTEYVSGVPQTASRFEWDRWDLVRETAPDETVTRYYQPRYELTSFERGSSLYQVHADALGNVRAITDSNGNVAAHYEFDAWGNTLSSSADLTGGFHYRFVGAYGVRFDPTSGLNFMRARWYEGSLGRFLTRDLIDNPNTYAYADNNPITLIDPAGLQAGPSPEEIDPWILEHKQDIIDIAKRANIPAAVICATIQRECGNETGSVAGNLAKTQANRDNPAKSLFQGSIAYGPAQIHGDVAWRFKDKIKFLDTSTTMGSFTRTMVSMPQTALEASAYYLRELYEKNLEVRRSINPNVNPNYSIKGWTRVISAYNTGNWENAGGFFNDVPFTKGGYRWAPYEEDIREQLRDCIGIFGTK